MGIVTPLCIKYTPYCTGSACTNTLALGHMQAVQQQQKIAYLKQKPHTLTFSSILSLSLKLSGREGYRREGGREGGREERKGRNGREEGEEGKGEGGLNPLIAWDLSAQLLSCLLLDTRETCIVQLGATYK